MDFGWSTVKLKRAEVVATTSADYFFSSAVGLDIGDGSLIGPKESLFPTAELVAGGVGPLPAGELAADDEALLLNRSFPARAAISSSLPKMFRSKEELTAPGDPGGDC